MSLKSKQCGTDSGNNSVEGKEYMQEKDVSLAERSQRLSESMSMSEVSAIVYYFKDLGVPSELTLIPSETISFKSIVQVPLCLPFLRFH